MKVFGIAVANNETFGHGDNGVIYKIEPQDAYGCEPHPPVFQNKEDAVKYANENFPSFVDTKIVEMELL